MDYRSVHHYEARHFLGMRIDDGNLEILDVLGSGAEGEVFLAKKTRKTGVTYGSVEQLAVKLVTKVGYNKDAIDRLRKEIALHRRASQERHPNIVWLLNTVETPSAIFLVTRYCRGGDLYERITSPSLPPLDDVRIRNIILQLIEALLYLQSIGIAHRDLKPENLFWIEEEQRLLLGDFGLSTEERYTSDFGSGTSFYASPEAVGFFATDLVEYGNSDEVPQQREGARGRRRDSRDSSEDIDEVQSRSSLSSQTPYSRYPGDADSAYSRVLRGGDASSTSSDILRLSNGPSDSSASSYFAEDVHAEDPFHGAVYDAFVSDIWSLGIVIINLVCARNPWQYAARCDDAFVAYIDDPAHFLLTILPNLSDECHEVLKGVLTVEPEQRMSLEQCRALIWEITSFTCEAILPAAQPVRYDDIARTCTFHDEPSSVCLSPELPPRSATGSRKDSAIWFSSECGSEPGGRRSREATISQLCNGLNGSSSLSPRLSKCHEPSYSWITDSPDLGQVYEEQANAGVAHHPLPAEEYRFPSHPAEPAPLSIASPISFNKSQAPIIRIDKPSPPPSTAHELKRMSSHISFGSSDGGDDSSDFQTAAYDDSASGDEMHVETPASELQEPLVVSQGEPGEQVSLPKLANTHSMPAIKEEDCDEHDVGEKRQKSACAAPSQPDISAGQNRPMWLPLQDPISPCPVSPSPGHSPFCLPSTFNQGRRTLPSAPLCLSPHLQAGMQAPYRLTRPRSPGGLLSPAPYTPTPFNGPGGLASASSLSASPLRRAQDAILEKLYNNGYKQNARRGSLPLAALEQRTQH